GVPVLDTPGAGTWTADDATQSLAVKFGGATGPVDLTVVTVSSGNGLVTWMIVGPGAKNDFTVPHISNLPVAGNFGLVSGGIETTVNVARIDQFEYGKLRYGQLSQGAWNAYATDALDGAY